MSQSKAAQGWYDVAVALEKLVSAYLEDFDDDGFVCACVNALKHLAVLATTQLACDLVRVWVPVGLRKPRDSSSTHNKRGAMKKGRHHQQSKAHSHTHTHT